MKPKAKRIYGKIISVLLIASLLMGGIMAEVSDFVGDGTYGITVSAAQSCGNFEYDIINGTVTIPDD